MPVRVTIPIRLRVDPAALTERQADVEEALAAAVSRALVNSRDAVLEKRGSYVGVRVHPPEFTWIGDGLTGLASEMRLQTEDIIANCLAQAITFSKLFEAPKSSVRVYQSLPSPPQVAEPLDQERLYAALGVYEIPSYDRQGAATSTPIRTPPQESYFRDEWVRITPGNLTPERIRELIRNAVQRWGALPTYPRGLILREARGWEVVIWTASDTKPLHFTFQNFGHYQYRQGRRQQVFVTPPPGQATAKRIAIGSTSESRRQAVQELIGEQIRSEIVRGLRRPATLSQAEYEQQLETRVAEQIEQLASSLPSNTVSLIEVRRGGYYVLLPMSTSEDAQLRWEGTANLLPSTLRVEIAPTAPSQIGAGEGQGGGASGANPSAAGTSGNGLGQGGTGATGSGDGEGFGDGQSQRQGGFVYTGQPSTASKSQFFPATHGSHAPLVCETFLGEPSMSELGAARETLNRLINEIAYKLQIAPCEFAAQFCLNAAAAIGLRAWSISASIGSLEPGGFTQPVPSGDGNLGAIQFRPVASPAIQFLQHLSSVVPQVAGLMRTILGLYESAEHRDKIRGTWAGQVTSWQLRFLEVFTPELENSVSNIFVVTCQALLLQLLQSSKQGIDHRIINFLQYAPIFERLMVSQLTEYAELDSLRQHLRNNEVAYQAYRLTDRVGGDGTSIIASTNPTTQWLTATRALSGAFLEIDRSLHSPGQAYEVIRDAAGVAQIRDSHGTLWSMQDLEQAMVMQRGAAEGIDPLVKQIKNVPEILERFRTNRSAIRNELWKVLLDMQANNKEMLGKVRNDAEFAFRASQIKDQIPTATIPGSGYDLQGIHLQAHLQIGEFFLADSYYATGVDFLFSSELGREALSNFGIMTGIIILSVLCPPLGFIAGVAVAGVEVAHAHEKERLYGALIDPELVLTRAEVELELFAAYLGFALSLIPEAGTIIGAARRGLRVGLRAGIRLGTRAAGRYVLRRASRQIIEAAAHDLLEVFVREIVTNMVMEQVIKKVMEPILLYVEREAQIRQSVGGTEGARFILAMLEEEHPPSSTTRHRGDSP